MSDCRLQPMELSDAERVDIKNYFKLIRAMYQPHETYVVDFARLVTGGYKVIEYNCFNCAGAYVVNLCKVINSLLIKY